MDRALVSYDKGNRVRLSEEEVAHLVRVRRARPGTLFEGIDGSGRILLCRLQRSASGWYGEILQEIVRQSESQLAVRLAQALVKKDKFEWILQKATELGVTELVPLQTARSEIRLSDSRETRKMQRWERIVAEAVKQCGRSRIPRLHPPVLLGEFLESPDDSLCFVLDKEQGQPLRAFLARQEPPRCCTVLVGPEGGWDATERNLFTGRQLPRISLGPRILRAETAPLAILSILQYEWGDLS